MFHVGNYLIFRAKRKEYSLISFTELMLAIVHYLLYMCFSPQRNTKTSGATKHLNPENQTALLHLTKATQRCSKWHITSVGFMIYLCFIELLALGKICLKAHRNQLSCPALKERHECGFMQFCLNITLQCEETADGTQWTICALELDDKPTETHREK